MVVFFSIYVQCLKGDSIRGPKVCIVRSLAHQHCCCLVSLLDLKGTSTWKTSIIPAGAYLKSSPRMFVCIIVFRLQANWLLYPRDFLAQNITKGFMFALHSQSVFVANPLSRSNSNSNIKMYQMYSNTVRPFVYLLFNLDRGKITGLIHLRLCCINLVRVLHYYIHPICIIKLSDKIQCCKTCNIADATKKKKHSFLFLAKKR